MSVRIPMNFDLNSNQPLDIRAIVDKLANANTEIPLDSRYAGMIAYMRDMNGLYWLDEDMYTWHRLMVKEESLGLDYNTINDKIIDILMEHECCDIDRTLVNKVGYAKITYQLTECELTSKPMWIKRGEQFNSTIIMDEVNGELDSNNCRVYIDSRYSYITSNEISFDVPNTASNIIIKCKVNVNIPVVYHLSDGITMNNTISSIKKGSSYTNIYTLNSDFDIDYENSSVIVDGVKLESAMNKYSNSIYVSEVNSSLEITITAKLKPDLYYAYSLKDVDPTATSGCTYVPTLDSTFVLTEDHPLVSKIGEDLIGSTIYKLRQRVGSGELKTSTDDLETAIRGGSYAIRRIVYIEGLSITSDITSLYSAFYEWNNLRAITFGSLDYSGLDYDKYYNLMYTFYKCTKLRLVENLESLPNSLSYMFSECTSLNENSFVNKSLSDWDLSNVNNICCLFYNCTGFTSMPVGNWDVSNVTWIESTFSGCTGLTTIPLDNWNTRSCTCMGSIFSYCTSLIEIPNIYNWDFSNVTIFRYMFAGLNFTTLDLTAFGPKVAKVTDMRGLAADSPLLTSIDLSNWKTSKVEDLRGLVSNCPLLTTVNLSNWYIGNAYNGYKSMFNGCTSLTRSGVITDGCNDTTKNMINEALDNAGIV